MIAHQTTMTAMITKRNDREAIASDEVLECSQDPGSS
jgi:hypothetical protein